MITQKEIKELLHYDPDTGLVYWRERGEKWFSANRIFSADQMMRGWNSRWAGVEAFTAITDTGYKQGSILGKHIKAHRIIWLLVHGKMPIEIDHINGIRTDNRMCNMRSVTRKVNAKNLQIKSDNTSGIIGVYFIERTGKWVSSITVDGVKKTKTFRTLYAASYHRHSMNINNGFHANHGRVAT